MTTVNFFPKTREEAIAQYVDVALDYRKGYSRPRSIGRRVALKAIRKAKRIRDASDWKKEVLAEL